MIREQTFKCFVWSLVSLSFVTVFVTFQETQTYIGSSTSPTKSVASLRSPRPSTAEASPEKIRTIPNIWVQLTFSLEFENDLMPHTLNHYIETLNVDPSRILVALHHQDPNETIAFHDTEYLLKEKYKIEHILRWTGHYTSNRLWKRRGELRELVNISKCDWIVRSDSDELPVVPGNDLAYFLEFVSLQGYDSVFGAFNDRVTIDGSLPNISAHTPIHEQFPLSCHVTDRVVQANMQKAVAFRAYHQENRGGHYLLKLTNHTYEAREGQGRDHCGYPIKLRIDHYKWTYPVIEKLRRREEYYRNNNLHYIQSLRFLEYIDGHGGKFDVGALGCNDTLSVPESFKMNYTDFYSTGMRCGRPKVQCPV